jgi:hypothetical protein
MQAGRVKFGFPLELSLSEVSALLPAGDTIGSVHSLHLHIAPALLLGQIISADMFHIEGLRLATGSFIEGIELTGSIARLSAKATIRPTASRIMLHDLNLSDAAMSLRIDSLSPPQEDTPAPDWTLEAGKISLRRIRFDVHLPADTLSLSSGIEQGEARELRIELEPERYAIGQVLLEGVQLDCQPMDIAVSHLSASLDSILYHGREMNLRLLSFAAAERSSGLKITAAGALVRSDSLSLRIPDFHLHTPSSFVRLEGEIPWSVWDEPATGNMRIRLQAEAGKSDLFLLKDVFPDPFRASFPDAPASLTAEVSGNLSALKVHPFNLSLPGAFTFAASGQAGHIADSLRRSARILLDAQMEKTDFALDLLPPSQRQGLRIPDDIALTGEVELLDGEYLVNLLLSEARGRIDLQGRYHTTNQSYQATLSIDSLEPVHFLPADSLMWLAASLRAEGRGTDLFADSARATWEGRLAHLRYGATELKDVALYASLQNHQAQLQLTSRYPAAAMDISFDGALHTHALKGIWIGDVDSLDLRALHLTQMPLATSFQLFAEMESDFGIHHRADLTLGNWELTVGERAVKPKTLTLHARTGTDTTRLSFHAGDLGIVLVGNDDIETLRQKITRIADDASRQLREDSTIHIAALRPLLPGMTLAAHAGHDNPVYNVLREYDLDAEAFQLDASASPEGGLRLDASLHTFYLDTFRIDTIRAIIRPDSAGLRYKAEVIKNRYRRQEPFTARVEGTLRHRYANADFLYANNRNEIGLRLGIRALQEAGGILLHLYPEDPVVAFNTFRLNPNNYIRFRSPKDIEADVLFSGEANSSFRLRAIADEADVAGSLPELHAELNRIDMNVVSTGFAALPRMEGMMSADLRYAPSEESFMVAGDVHIDSFRYEGGRVGEMMLNAIYLPLDDDVHQVDAHFYHNRREVSYATAVYEARREQISGSLTVDTLPIGMFTPFIPDGMASLGGALNGQMEISGTSDAPLVNGYLQLDTASIYTSMAASRFRLDNQRLVIHDNRALFNDFKVYAAGSSPLALSGDIHFADPAHILANLRLNGNNLQALDVKRNPESLVYGRLLLNVGATLQGPLDALSVRGDIQLLGGTNLTYVMKESPLTVQDRLKDLVSFTSFADTTLRRRRGGSFTPAPVGGMDLLMRIHIDPVVQLRADLTPDRSSFVALEGGGDLSFQYTRQGEMLLNGRYTLSDGNLKYALPIIPLKEFRIKDESYIHWDGNPINPLLGLAATQRMRTSVALPGESPRMVNFDVGIDVRQRLENMSLRFIIAAPEDIAVQGELDKLDAEGRSTRAVGMMVTGMYLANGSDGKVNLNMGDALGNFLQGEINNIAGDALRTVDLSFGVNTYDQDDGTEGSGQRTDYSFRFAKRFYNDRLRVVIGGKVSSGADVQQRESFIDNASLEWRLNKAGTGHLKVFHDKNYQSLLDGEVTETGLGLVLRRRMRYWYELFR